MLIERPLLLPLMAMAVGLSCADLVRIHVSAGYLIVCFVCLAVFSLFSVQYVFRFFTVCFFVLFGIYSLTYLTPPPNSPNSLRHTIRHNALRTPLTLEGIVQTRPIVSDSGGKIVVAVERRIDDNVQTTTDGNILLYVSSGDIPFERGDRIRFVTHVSFPRLLGLPGEFDYPRYLTLNDIDITGRVTNSNDIVLIKGAANDSLMRSIDKSAGKLSEFIRSSIPDPRVSSVLTALLIGDQKRIPADLASAYTRAGVNHILSISGFHIGIISYAITALILALLSCSQTIALSINLRRAVLLISLPVMAWYLVLTGSAPATARAVIMLAMFVIALYAERETDPINLLLLSAFLLLSMNPPVLFDISFQLSFLALWGIVLITPAVMAKLPDIKQSWLRTFIQFLIASSAASCATAVPVLFTFAQTSLNGVIANILIVPILGYGAVLAGFAALPFVYIFQPAAHLLLRVAGELTLVSNRLIALFADMPTITFHAITGFDMAMFLGCMCSATFLSSKRIKWVVCSLLVFSAGIQHVIISNKHDGLLHITMLSVGQAEAILIQLPDRSTVLVDGGGYLHDTGHDFGERILAPALLKLGINRIDHMISTHRHPDHAGGLPFIIKTIPVGKFWEPASDFKDSISELLKEKKIPVKTVSSADIIPLSDDISLQILSPQKTIQKANTAKYEVNLNEQSLVFRLVYKQFSMLFTADAGFETEQQLLSRNSLPRSTVLKVGHHGSRYSTSEQFIARVAPVYALISAGYGNNFGLPAKATLKMLERFNITTFRTDLDGTIDVQTDGTSVTIETPCKDKLLSTEQPV